LGGDSFKIRLDAAAPSVGEAKAEIARVQGTEVDRQELYRVEVREDGGAVREDDAEPELLDDDTMALEEGAVVAMAVKESPLLWRTFPEEFVELREGGTVAYQTKDIDDNAEAYPHVTTGVELTEGRHYWEVALRSEKSDELSGMLVGVTRPNLDPLGDYIEQDCTDSWFINAFNGSLCGNGKYDDDGAGHDEAGPYKQGDRVGVLLDLNKGSLLFFKNGVQNGPGYAAGSVTGPVVAAAELSYVDQAVRLHADVAFPAGHAQ
jgi:hypothetical protein